MQLHPKKLEYIEQEAFRILGHFEEVEEEKQTARSIQGSLEHRMTLDLTDKLADKPLLEHTFSAGETISVQECYKGKCIRLSPDNYPEFKKFIWNIYNEKEIKAHISVDFVEETAIKWMTTTIRNKKAENSFSTYLINKMDDSIEELKIHFPVLNLDIESPIIIGNAKLEYFTKEYFD
ncbi:MAG: hypothetical protein KG003_04790, partial [Bacteroidetes bacterium]|nr:hypothetical protein [Bacteroidota bacterium]